MKKLFSGIAVFCFAWPFYALSVAASDFIEVAKKSSPSVVLLVGHNPHKGNRRGSGVIIDAEKGYVLTNAHVVINTSYTEVFLGDLKPYKSCKTKLKGVDIYFDIALLQLVDCAENLTALPLGDSLSTAQEVMSISFPVSFVDEKIVNVGEVMKEKIYIEDNLLPGQQLFGLHPTAMIKVFNALGSSGGAIVNSKGELVGLVKAINELSADGHIGFITYAIRISDIKHIIEALIQNGVYPRGFLPVSVYDILSKEFIWSPFKNIVNTLTVKDILPSDSMVDSDILNMPLKDHEYLKKYFESASTAVIYSHSREIDFCFLDIILAIRNSENGKNVYIKLSADFWRYIMESQPDTPIKVVVLRAGKIHEIPVVIENAVKFTRKVR